MFEGLFRRGRKRDERQIFNEALESRTLMSAGAATPYTTYEAEAGTYTGTLIGPSYAQNTIAGESSGRQAVQLSTTGQYAQIAAASAANSVVVRYSIPDSANGVGNDSTISLYIDGAFAKTLAVTSKYSWQYGTYPFNNTPSNGSPRNFYDEVRVSGLTINPGSTVRIQRNATDTASSYAIDLIDLENVAAPIAQPANSLNVKTYGAAGDGAADDTTALRNAINAAISQSRTLFLPTGNYKISGALPNLNNVTIQGAGMWYTNFVGNASLYNTSSGNRIAFNGAGSNIHLNDFAITGNLNYRSDSEGNDSIGGSYGTGSSVSNLWIEHVKTGIWITNSNGMTIDGCRLRDTLADGMNLVVGMRSTLVTNCTARGTGDDCFAMWPTNYITQTYTPGFNTYSHCTGIAPYLANGGAIYGGQSNTIDNSLFQDINSGSGVLISGTFDVGNNTFTGTTTVSNTDVNRSGGGKYLAAVQFAMNNHPIAGVVLSNLNLTNNPYSGVGVNNSQTLTASASNLNIPTVGLAGAGYYGVYSQNNAIGSLAISNSTIVDYNQASANFGLSVGNSTSVLPTPWTTGDINDVGTKGSASYNSSTDVFTLAGAGSDIAGTADAFRFASRPVTGDAQINATVQSLQNTSAIAKAGVMFRNSNATNSAYVAVVVTPSNGVIFQYRATAGGATTSSTRFSVAAPVQLQLRRVGNSFTGLYSLDGTTWTQIAAPATVALNASALAGMAVTAHSTAIAAAAQFANVSVVPLKQAVQLAGPLTQTDPRNIWGTRDDANSPILLI